MNESYQHINNGGVGYCEQKRGLIAVWGKEAVQFLNGMITNDAAKLEDGGEMLAAFPNAQGRLIAVVRVKRIGERFLFDTEEATHEKVFTTLFRFTMAGDFFVEDFSEQYRYFELFGNASDIAATSDEISFDGRLGTGRWLLSDTAPGFRDQLAAAGAMSVDDETFEVLRIERGIPKFGVDMDETTIVPELGIDGLISYNKGCYVGQEIIARIHFRGHVAKQLTGLILSDVLLPGAELMSADGKNAGKITSVNISPAWDKTVALGFVRYDYLAEGTELISGGSKAVVTGLPFVP